MSRLVMVTVLSLVFGVPVGAEEKPKVLHRIAFGSCAKEDRPQPIWQHVVEAKPDIFLWLGDNIYGDTESMDVMRAKYAKLAAQPGYKQLQATCPILATWDDHDYGVNDGGTEYPKKAESQQVFHDFFGVPKDSPLRKRKGVYSAHMFGEGDRRVQILMLDTRYFRSPLKKKENRAKGEGPYEANPVPDVTMLGEEQWAWLEKQLKKPAELRIVGSSIQVVAEDHGWEKWMNLPSERERLFALIRKTKAGGVVFLSGDRHKGELSMMDGGVGYPLFDVTASGINQAFKKWRKLEKNRHRVGTLNYGDHFGMIVIDWEREQPRVRFQIIDNEGDIVLQRKVLLKTLQPGTIE